MACFPRVIWLLMMLGLFTPPAFAGEFLLNLSALSFSRKTIRAAESIAKSGTGLADCSEGAQCAGYIKAGDWLRYDGVDFGKRTENLQFRVAAASGTGGNIEIHLDSSTGKLLGVCEVSETGDWQKWQNFTAKIKPTSGMKNR